MKKSTICKRSNFKKLFPQLPTLILLLSLFAFDVSAQCTLDAGCRRDMDESCVGAADGQVSVITSGGTAPITFLWSANAGSATTPVVSGLPAGLYTVTATDMNGCIDICAAQVNIGSDTNSPIVTCADFTASFDDCPAGLGPNTPNGVWFPIGPAGGFTAASGGSYSMFLDLSTCISDNCTDLEDIEVTLFSSYIESSTACAITLVNEFSVRDQAGNISPDRIITRFTIEDMSGTPPMIVCPPNVTLECDESTVPLIDGGTLPNPSAMDACDPAPMLAYSDTFTPGSCDQNRVIERTWTAINACGITSSCMQTITVQDTEGPVVTCAEFTATYDGCPGPLGPNTPNGAWIAVGPDGGFTAASGGIYSVTVDLTSCVVDNCGPLENLEVSLHSSYVENRTSCAVTLVNEFSVRDECGNVAADRVITKITVQDVEAPVVTCAPFTATYDGCPAPLGPNTPTGNWISIPASGTFLAASGGIYSVTVDLNGCVSDNCTNLEDMEWSLHSSYEENRTSCSVTLVNELSIRDECGLISPDRVITKITVQDVEAPVVTCADFTETYTGCPSGLGPNTPNGVWFAVGADGGFTAASGGIYTVPVDLTSCVSDNCTDLEDIEVTLHSSYEENRTDCQVTLVNEFSVRDACGLVSPDKFITKITVQDDEAPEVSCADFTATFTGCPSGLGPNTPNGVWFPIGADGGFTAASGGSFTIPVDLTPCVSDNCTSLPEIEYTLHSSYEEGRTDCQVTLVNEFSLRDECGNISNDRVITRITIMDDEAPEVTCDEFVATFNRCPDPLGPNTPNGVWFAIGADGGFTTAVGGSSTAFLDLSGCIMDNCQDLAELEVTLHSSYEENRVPGCSVDILNEFNVRDACENIALGRIVFRGQIRFDGDPPTIVCPAEAVVECLSPTDPSVTGMATGSSECGDVMITFNDEFTPSCGMTGTIVRTWIATDACGKTSSCTQNIVIVDTTPPTIVCPADLTINCEDSIDPSNVGMATATDGCSGPPVLTFSDFSTQESSGCGQFTYTITRTWEAVDDCGQSSTCVQIIEVEDVEGPMITCSADMTVECEEDIEANVSLVVATDNCDIPEVTFVGPILIAGQADCDGAVYEVTYTATDVCGNTPAVCTQTWTLRNNGPIITCPAPVTVECGEDIVVDPSDVTVVTSCGSTFTTEVFGPNVYDGLPNCPGSRYVYRYLVTDECGRVAVCSREFFIENDAPTITCSPDQIVTCEDEIITDPEQMITFTTSCDLEADIEVDGPNLVGGVPTCNGAQYDVTYTVTDPCGRSATCTIRWTLSNSGPSIVMCAPDRIVECNADIVSEPELLEVELACGTYQIFPSNIFAINGLGNCPGAQYGITYQVFDVCGRSASCTQVWTIENEAPRVIPPNPIVVACLDDVNPNIFDAEVETSCGLAIERREIIGPIYDEDQPLCTGSVVTFLYSFWDECGRMTCEAQTVTINPGAAAGPEFDDVYVECDLLPVAPTSLTACGIDYDLTMSEKIKERPGSSDDYKVIRTYSGTDECGNIFMFDQTIFVRCDASPQQGSDKLCMLSDAGWADQEYVMEHPIFSKVKVTPDNPLVIGHGERMLLIHDYACIANLLPIPGKPRIFSYDMNVVDLYEENNCTGEFSEPVRKSIFENSLLSQLIALNLNFQVNPQAAGIDVTQLCIEIDPKLLDELGSNTTIAALYELAEKAISGGYTGNTYRLSNEIRRVLEYFTDCPSYPCEIEVDNLGYSDRVPQGFANFEIYPNPAVDQLNIIVKDVQEELTIKIYSNIGEVVFDKSIKSSTYDQITIDHLPEGMYHTVLLKENRVVQTEKFIKVNEF